MVSSADAVVRALDQWARALPPRAAALERGEAVDAEFGPSVTYSFRPGAPGACPLDVQVLDDGSCGFFLDSWSRLAARLGVERSRLGLDSDDFFVLVHEPTRVAPEQALAVCRAVAAGEVRVEVGVRRGRVVATGGRVGDPPLPVAFRGVGGPLGLHRALETLGLRSLRRVRYSPWLPPAAGGGPLSFR